MIRRCDLGRWEGRSHRRRKGPAGFSPATSIWSPLLLGLLLLLPPAAAQSSWGSTYNVTAGVLSKAWDYVTENVGACINACTVLLVCERESVRPLFASPGCT